MTKKKMKKDIQYFIDGKPASLLEVAENSGDDKVWKSFLESHPHHGIQFTQSAGRYLKSKLGGEYMNANEVSASSGIKSRILDKWRNQGILRAEQLNGRWF